MSVESFFRIVGAIVGGLLFATIGLNLASFLAFSPNLLTILGLGAVGVILGLVLTPYFTSRPLQALHNKLAAMSSDRLLALSIGLLLGLVMAALLTVPLAFLPPPLRQFLPILGAFVLCYTMVSVLLMRHSDVEAVLRRLRPSAAPSAAVSRSDRAEDEDVILLDTSVIIDGRITDISTTGFIRSTLLVPGFILSELQHIADSSDSLRRNRGRRGLEVLSILQNDTAIPIRFSDMDISEVRDADSKLVALARHLHCPIMTNDYNLNRVAELQGITVLNINDLANAVKALYLPGEELEVRIIQEGKEHNQGVGYLEDGTMVVVEDGRAHINETHTVTVTKALQTTAGRMIFARL